MRRLQDFDYRSSPYHRPGDDWHCGWTDAGGSCALGPDRRGQCRAAAQCAPKLVQGRWQCTRSDLAGGPCSAGPGPEGQCAVSAARCRPRRSWRARRRLVSNWVASIAIGLVLIVLVSDSVPALVEPGHRSAAHAEIENCRDCHVTADGGPSSWLRAALGRSGQPGDTERCLVCHRVGAQPRAAHSVDPEALKALTDRHLADATIGQNPGFALRAARGLFHGDNASPACGVCHQEHRGAKADLEGVLNARCQVCHQRPFASLADGHPSFSRYPAPRRNRIIFDHQSHFGRHFETDAEHSPPAQCKACHRPDNAGRLMLVKSYEQVCAGCHDRDIAGAGQGAELGLPFIGVFALDTATLQARGYGVGSWPRHADGLPDQFLLQLLRAEPEVAAALRQLQGVSLWDLRDSSDAVLEASQRLAMSTKALVDELEMQGPAIVAQRLERAWQRDIDARERVRLLAMLPVATLRQAASAWFPARHSELAAWREGRPIPLDSGSEPTQIAAPAAPAVSAADLDDDLLGGGLFDEAWSDAADDLLDDEPLSPPRPPPAEELMALGGWYVDDLHLRYRPAGHRDSFLRAWLDARPDAALFDALSDPQAPGRCGYCHSVDADAAGPRINWKPRVPEPQQHPFTVFSHTAHFSMLGEPGCATCHELDPDADYLAGFDDRDPHRYASNFKDIDRQVCAGCHTASLAGDDCTLCHRYHIGEFEPTVPPTRLDQFARQRL